ncbi:hypothetical protein B0H14DRAFT_2641568 [Mycena olivaceomarginata]|nr:hypothetical protein B0H14DRAFT_2641568 [Mycena olivaceomarginata]
MASPQTVERKVGMQGCGHYSTLVEGTLILVTVYFAAYIMKDQDNDRGEPQPDRKVYHLIVDKLKVLRLSSYYIAINQTPSSSSKPVAGHAARRPYCFMLEHVLTNVMHDAQWQILVRICAFWLDLTSVRPWEDVVVFAPYLPVLGRILQPAG